MVYLVSANRSHCQLSNTFSSVIRCFKLFFQDSSFKAIARVVQSISIVSEVEKFLVLVNDLLDEDLTRSEQFNDAVEEPWKAFDHLLRCSDGYVRNMGSRIMTKLMVGHDKKRPPSHKIEFFLEWLKEELTEENEYILSVGRCLQRLLQVDEYRLALMSLKGILQIIKVMSRGIKPQAQYQFCFCLWVTTFNPYLAERLNKWVFPFLIFLLVKRDH